MLNDITMIVLIIIVTLIIDTSVIWGLELSKREKAIIMLSLMLIIIVIGVYGETYISYTRYC